MFAYHHDRLIYHSAGLSTLLRTSISCGRPFFHLRLSSFHRTEGRVHRPVHQTQIGTSGDKRFHQTKSYLRPWRSVVFSCLMALSTAPAAVEPDMVFSHELPRAQEVLVYYAYDSFDIPMDFDAELEKLAIRLSDNPEAKALIEGHTDDTGARGYNKRLSLERAEAVTRRLVQQYAVNPDQIELIGFGEDRPREDAPEEQPQNRRAVILVE
jgi:outer membrane protein OmpA-like peptidoglycan-associated protein